jgi:hypothetical protein
VGRHGERLTPGYDPLAEAIPEDEVRIQLRRMKDVIRRGIDAPPTQSEFLAGPRAAVPPDAQSSQIAT